MKRLFLGIAWFLLLCAGLWLLANMGLVVLILKQLPANADQSVMIQAASDYAYAHADGIRRMDLAILLLAALLAILGTLTGKLPGTRKAEDRKP